MDNLPRYKVRVKKIDFEVPTRYSDLTYLGGGSYGLVCSAKDATRAAKEDNGSVAIKRIGGVFRDVVDAKRILREMKLLRHLSGHANIVGIHAIFSGPSGSKQRFNDIYLVTPLYQSDLFKIIQSEQTLSPAHARYFVYQILRGLKYIHSANIIHRDLKPANLLINSDCGLAICDFGLARGVRDLNDSMRQKLPTNSSDSNSTVQLTHYVVTRWYRAPELLVENDNYGKEIDMWSVGCILGEILGRRVLFRGRDYLDQLKQVINVLGTPPESEMYFVKNRACRRAMQTMGRKRKREWNTIYPHAEKQALDLLDKLLTFDPAKRITVEEAMRHPYISEYSQPDREPICERSFNFDFELSQDIQQPSRIRELMREEMVKYPLSQKSSTTSSSSLFSSSTENKSESNKQSTASTTASTASTSSRTSSSKKKIKKYSPPIPAEKRVRSTPTSRGSGVGSSEKKRPNNRRTSPNSPQISSPSSLLYQRTSPPNIPIAAPSRISPPYPTNALTSDALTGLAEEFKQMLSGVSNDISNANARQIGILEKNVINEMQNIENRIMTRMETIVNDVVTRKLGEFERRLEAGEDEERTNVDVMAMSSMSIDDGRTEANILSRSPRS